MMTAAGNRPARPHGGRAGCQRLNYCCMISGISLPPLS